jgi:transcriptional regulator with XRE-family HTH domain
MPARLAPPPDAEPNETFAERVRRLRLERRLTQRQLSDRLGYANDDTVSHWETANRRPRGDQYPALARALRVTLDYLHTGREAPQLAALHRAILIGTPAERLVAMVRGNECA